MRDFHRIGDVAGDRPREPSELLENLRDRLAHLPGNHPSAWRPGDGFRRLDRDGLDAADTAKAAVSHDDVRVTAAPATATRTSSRRGRPAEVPDSETHGASGAGGEDGADNADGDRVGGAGRGVDGAGGTHGAVGVPRPGRVDGAGRVDAAGRVGGGGDEASREGSGLGQAGAGGRPSAVAGGRVGIGDLPALPIFSTNGYRPWFMARALGIPWFAASADGTGELR